MVRILLAIGLMLALVFAGCAGSTPNNQSAASNLAPQVQTPPPDVQQPAPTQTYVCPDGTVVIDLSKCQKQKCSDGTEYGGCSLTKPKFCENGVLSEDAAKCGCPDGFNLEYGGCIKIKTVEAKYCPDLGVPSRGLVPGKYSDYTLDSDILERVNWDGWAWTKSSVMDVSWYDSLLCNKGKEKGENINYLYCTNTLHTLTKSFADGNGVVQTTVSYYMKWVYVPAGSDYTIKEIQYYDSWISDKPTCTSEYS